MSVRVRCDRCGSLAKIKSSSEEDPTYKKLYCACENLECGHTFVMHMTFSHTLSPSALDLPESVRQKIRHGGREQQLELFAGLGG
ncbi:MAG: ogr/Delta-like zinc finger family protein [Desulfovibrio sp.]